jgi:hypothetical protein
MRAEGRIDFRDEAPPHTSTFIKIVIISTSWFVLQEGVTPVNGGVLIQPEAQSASIWVEALWVIRSRQRLHVPRGIFRWSCSDK